METPHTIIRAALAAFAVAAFPQSPPSSLVVPPTNISSGTQAYEAANTITTTGGTNDINVGGSASVLFQVTNTGSTSITLLPGFTANATSAGNTAITFKALVGTLATTPVPINGSGPINTTQNIPFPPIPTGDSAPTAAGDITFTATDSSGYQCPIEFVVNSGGSATLSLLDTGTLSDNVCQILPNSSVSVASEVVTVNLNIIFFNNAEIYAVTTDVIDTAGNLVPFLSAGTWTVTAPPPVITTTSLPTGEMSVQYSQTVAASSGTPPYTWSLQSGTLPAGLSLSSSGVLSGTPSAAGTFNPTIKVTDSAGMTATQAYSLTVTSAPAITTTSLPSGVAGVYYSQTLTAQGGTAPYTFSLQQGSLPGGLTLSSSGTVSGSPSVCICTFTVQVTDQDGASSSAAFTISIGSFTLTTSGQTVNVVQGKANLFLVSLTSEGGFASPVTVTPSTSTSGLSVSGSTVTPAFDGSSATINLAASSSTPVGAATVNVTASGSGLTSSSISVPINIVAAQPDFLISNPSPSVTVIPGTSLTPSTQSTFTETVTPIDGFDGTIGIVVDTWYLTYGTCGQYTTLSAQSYANNVLTVSVWVNSYINFQGAPNPCVVAADIIATGVPNKTIYLTITLQNSGSGFSVQPAQTSVDVGSGSAVPLTASVITTGGFQPPVGLTATPSDQVNITATPVSSTLPDSTGALGTTVNVVTTPSLRSGNNTVTLSGTPSSSMLQRGPVGLTSHAAVSITMAEYDNSRSGANTNEYTLTPANVMSNHFALQWIYTVDSCVWAHPLYLSKSDAQEYGINVTTDVVYLATANNSIYAFDADSATPIWQQNYGPPGAAYALDPRYPDLNGCLAGIMGTPVIDLPANSMYFVARLQQGSTQVYQLHAISLSNGAEQTGSPVSIATPSGSQYQFNAATQMQRPALLLTQNHILVGFGSFGDYSPWQGWLFSFTRSGTHAQDGAVPLLIPGTAGLDGNAIWMAGGGIAYDGTHNKAYFATGNNTSGDSKNVPKVYLPPGDVDYSSSIVQVDPDNFANSNCTPLLTSQNTCPQGQETVFWAPAQQDVWDTGDGDLGSSRVVLFPNGSSTAAITAGKAGDPTSGNPRKGTFVIVPNIETPGSGSVVAIDICTASQVMNNFVYWNGYIYTWCEGTSLRRVATQTLMEYAAAWGAPGPGATLLYDNCEGGGTVPVTCAPSGTPAANVGTRGGQLSISASPVANANCPTTQSPNNVMCAIVWGVTLAGSSNLAGQPGYFVAYDAITLQPLQRFYLGATLPVGDEPLGPAGTGDYWMKFTPPVVANGRVYVSTSSNKVLVYGLGPAPGPGPVPR